jgi:DNA-binding transcriptional MerR regulator
MTVREFYTTKRAAELTDLSPAMLHYFRRIGILSGAGTRGSRRGRKQLYSFGDLVVLRALARLLEQGIEVKRLKDQIRVLIERSQNMTSDPYFVRFLATDGHDIFYCPTSESFLEQATSGQLAFAFLLDVHQIQREIAGEYRTPMAHRRRRPRGRRSVIS